MHDIDLAVVVRSKALWRSIRAGFDRVDPIDVEPGPEAPDALALGTLRPDFGPGYKALLVRLGAARPAPVVQRIYSTYEPPCTVAVAQCLAVPGKHLGPGDVVLSRSIPGYAWNRSVGRGVGSGAEPEAAVDVALLRGPLGLDAADQRWTREGSAARPDDLDRPPRLLAGPVASTTDPVTRDARFDDATVKGLARRWPKLIAVDADGLDVATVVCTHNVPRPTILLGAVVGVVGGDAVDGELVRYAGVNVAAFLRSWIRHAWPDRPVSAATGQTPKGIRLEDGRRRRSRSGPVSNVIPAGDRPSSPLPVVRSKRGDAPARSPTPPRGRPRPRSGPVVVHDADGTAERTRSPETPIRGRPRPRTGSLTGSLGRPEMGRPTSGAVSLRAQLARLYPTADDARRVLAELGIDAESIDLSGGASTRWFRILERVRKRTGGVDRLLRILAEHGN